MDICARIGKIKSHVDFDCEIARLAHNGLKLIHNGLKEGVLPGQGPLLLPLLDGIEKCPAWKNCQDFWGCKDIIIATIDDVYEFFTHRKLFDPQGAPRPHAVPPAGAPPRRAHRLESALGKLIYIVQWVFNTILRAAGVLEFFKDCGVEYKVKFLDTLRTVGSHSSLVRSIGSTLAEGFERAEKSAKIASVVGVLLDVWEQCRDIAHNGWEPDSWWTTKAFVKIVQDGIKLVGVGAKALGAENVECIAKVLNSIIKLCAS